MLRLQIEDIGRQQAVDEASQRAAIGRSVVIDQQIEIEQRVRQQAFLPAQARAVEQHSQRRSRMARTDRLGHRLNGGRGRLGEFFGDEVGQLGARVHHGRT